MAFNSTTGLGVAAQILSTGNIHPGKTTPGYNGVKLSLTGVGGYPETFQLDPVVADVSGAVVDTGVALVLTSVAASSVGVLVLTSVAASTDGIHSVFTGTITGGGSNAFAGDTFTVAGFTNAANNGVFGCTASSATTLTLVDLAVAETHAATAASDEGVAVYTGTITGGGSNALAGQDFTIAGFVTNPTNNGTFLATASSATTLTLVNVDAIAETHAATATSEESGTNKLTYVAYPSKTLTGNTYQPSGTSTAVATVGADGLITAVALGHVEVEVSFPTFNNSVGDVVSSGNPMNGLPINKIYSSVNVEVLA
jgi:hypothetical protein